MHKVALVLLALLAGNNVSAQDQERTIRQYQHYKWSVADGAPEVVGFAQAADGWFWMISSRGADTFDGRNFYTDSYLGNPQSIDMSALLAASDGSMWFGYRFGGLLRIRGDDAETVGVKDGIPDGEVHALVQDAGGTIWVATSGGLGRYDGTRWRIVADWPATREGVFGAFISRDQTLWLATRESLLAVDVTRSVARLARQIPADTSRKHFAQTPDGKVWLSATGMGITRVDRPSLPLLTDKRIGQLLVDRSGNIWMAGDALRRIRREHQTAELAGKNAARIVEEYSADDGLGGAVVHALFEDSYGVIWVGTSGGFQSLRDEGAMALPLPPGMDVWGTQTLVAAGGSVVWIAASGGPALLRYDNGKLVQRMDAPPMTAGTRATDGTVWFGGTKGMFQIQGDRLASTDVPREAVGRAIRAMTPDANEGVWVSVDGVGVYRVRKGRWEFQERLAGLPGRHAISAATTSRGEVWLGYPRNTLARIFRDEVKVYTANDGLKVGAVLSMASGVNRLWIGGDASSGMFDGVRFHEFVAKSCGWHRGVSGMVEAPGDALIFLRNGGLVYIPGISSQMAAGGTTHPLQCERHSFSVMKSEPGPSPSYPTLVHTTDGRLWFTGSESPEWIHESYFQKGVGWQQESPSGEPLPPRTEIRTLTWQKPLDTGGVQTGRYLVQSGRIAIDGTWSTLPPGEMLQLPIHTREILIEFKSPLQKSYANTRFKTRLLGYSDVWRSLEVGAERMAHYTNLRPGNYRFEIQTHMQRSASPPSMASMEFAILPAFYQTYWFQSVCVGLGLVALGLLFRLQLRRAGTRMRERLEARVSERERIARDLHDTLLQGVQGLIMKIHAASLQMPERTPTRNTLEDALDAAQSVLVEGRDRVASLREHDTPPSEMTNDIASIGERLAEDQNVTFRSSVHGATRALHPLVQEETLLIVREALHNAFRHANARHITTDVFFERNALRIVICDDGQGIPDSVLAHGGPRGHWGLVGMRERARRIRAIFEIEHREPRGTRVKLQVRASVAYRSRRLKLPWLWSPANSGAQSRLTRLRDWID